MYLFLMYSRAERKNEIQKRWYTNKYSLYLVLGFTTSTSDKYCGARPFSVLKTKIAILNSTPNFTGNQWSSLSTGVMWANLGIKQITRAAALRTFWTRSWQTNLDKTTQTSSAYPWTDERCFLTTSNSPDAYNRKRTGPKQLPWQTP